MSKLLDAQGRTIADGDYVSLIEVPFQWATLDEIKKEVLLTNLSEAIQNQIKEAIKERIRTSFDADKFRKMSAKDVFMIEMVLRVPVSLMSSILKEFDEEVQRQSDTPIPKGMDSIGQQKADDTKASESGEAHVPPLHGHGHEGAGDAEPE